MTIDENNIRMLGQLTFQIIALQTENQRLAEENAELKKKPVDDTNA